MTEITAHHGLFKDTHLHVDDTGGRPAQAGKAGSWRGKGSPVVVGARTVNAAR
jgi:hypothetical protein